MARYKTEFCVPYNHPDIKYYWDTFIKQTKKGNARAAIEAYLAFSEDRKKIFKKQRDLNKSLEL